MFDYALKNLTKRWVRTMLTIAGVTIMTTLIIVITGIVNYQKKTVHEHAAITAGKIHIQSLLSKMEYPAKVIDLSEKIADEILLRNDIQTMVSSKIIYWPLEEPKYPNEPPAIIVSGIEIGKEEAFTGSVGNDIKPIAGVEFFNATTEYPVILGFDAKNFFEKKLNTKFNINDSISILDKNFTIIGIIEKSADKVVNNSLMIPLKKLQSLLNKENFVSSVFLISEKAGGASHIVSDIKTHYPKLNILTADFLRKNLVKGMETFEKMVNTISAVVTICAIILIMTVMMITIKERTKEIGVLRALGASKKITILSMMWEIFLINLSANVLSAIISGLALRFLLENNLFDIFHIVIYLPFALLLTVVSGIIPVIQIISVSPIEALIYE